jgi:DNA-binding transcriptional LysR family regulator
MPLFLRRAAQALPDLRLELSDRPPDELQRMVEEGDLDAAFGAFFRPAVGIEHKPMFITAMLLVTPAEGPLAQIDADAPDSWHALHERPMICLPEDNPVQKLVDEALAERGITPASRVRLTHLESVVAMTEHGFGLATIPSFCELTAQRYRVRVHPLRPAVRFHYACITRAGRGAIDTVEQAARVFASVAHEVLQHRPLEPADEATPRPRRRRS